MEDTRTTTITNQPTLVFTQKYDAYQKLISKTLTKDNTIMLSESFAFDDDDNLIEYNAIGISLPLDEKGRAVVSQSYTYDMYRNIQSCNTTFSDGSVDYADYQYSDQDVMRLEQVVHSHPAYPSYPITYDAAGNVIRDDQGRQYKYDSFNNLLEIKDANGTLISS